MKKLAPLIPIAVFLLWWQFMPHSRALFPSLGRIFGFDITVWGHVLASLGRTAAGAAIGVCCGLFVGFLNCKAVSWFTGLLMPIPGIALAPLLMLWLGFGNWTLIAVGAFAAFFPVVINVSEGIRSLDPSLLKAAQTLGASKWRVMLPAAMVSLLSGLKLAWARAWRTVIACEFVAAASSGLGYMIWDAAEYLNMGAVYGGIVVLMGVFLSVDYLFSLVERGTVRKWGMVR